MSRESKCLKLLAMGILDFLGINCFFLVRKNICCHLLDFILHHHQCKVGPIFWLFYLEMCYHCLLQSWLDTNLCVWSVPHVSVNVPVWTLNIMQAQQEHCDCPACSSPVSCELGGFFHSYKYLVVQTPVTVCSMIVFQGLFGVVKCCLGAMLGKLEGQLLQSSEMRAPLVKFQDFCPTSAMSGIHLGNIRVL